MKRRGNGARLATELLDRAQARASYRILVAGSASVDNFTRSSSSSSAAPTGDKTCLPSIDREHIAQCIERGEHLK